MKLVAHLIRTDCRRLWPWLAVISLFVLSMNAIGFWIMAFLPLDSQQHVTEILIQARRAIGYLRVAGVVAGYVFTILLVQGNNTIGTAPFWLTRPISGVRLVLAKFSTAAVALILIPTALSIPWWWKCGFGPLEMTVASAEFAIVALGVAAPAALVGAFTDTLTRALIWGMLAVPITLTLMIVGMAKGALSVFGTVPGLGDAPLLAVPNVVVGIGVGFVSMILAVVAQYAWRRIGSSLAILAAGLVVAFALAAPSAPAWLTLAPQLHHPELAAQVRTEFLFETTWYDERNDEKQGHATVAINASGVPSGLYLDGDVGDVTWEWPNGEPIKRLGRATPKGNEAYQWMQTLGYHARPYDPETLAWERQRQEEWRAKWLSRPGNKELREKWDRDQREQRARWDAQRRYHWETLPTEKPNLYLNADLPASVVPRLWRAPAAVRAEFSLILVRPVIAAPMPFDAPTWKADLGCGFRAAPGSVPKHPTEWVIVASDPDNVIRSLRRTWSADRLRRSFVLLNPVLHEAEIANDYRTSIVTVNSVSIGCSNVGFGYVWVIRDGKKVPEDRGRYRGAILARMAGIEEARFGRVVSSDHLVTQEREPSP